MTTEDFEWWFPGTRGVRYDCRRLCPFWCRGWLVRLTSLRWVDKAVKWKVIYKAAWSAINRIMSEFQLTMIIKVTTRRIADKVSHRLQVLVLRLQREDGGDQTKSMSNPQRCRVWSSISVVFFQTNISTKLTILGPSKQLEAEYSRVERIVKRDCTGNPWMSRRAWTKVRMVAQHVKANESPVIAPKAIERACPVIEP